MYESFVCDCSLVSRVQFFLSFCRLDWRVRAMDDDERSPLPPVTSDKSSTSRLTVSLFRFYYVVVVVVVLSQHTRLLNFIIYFVGS